MIWKFIEKQRVECLDSYIYFNIIYTKLGKEEQNELFNAYLSCCKWNEIYYSWRPNLKDENDNFVVELAVASSSLFILTYNIKDFNDAELLFSHKVITPEDFIKEIL